MLDIHKNGLKNLKQKRNFNIQIKIKYSELFKKAQAIKINKKKML